MIDLSMDVEARKDLLAGFFSDKLQVYGSIKNVESVSLNKVMFDNHHIPNKDAILDSLRSDLRNAQVDGLNWQNAIQPQLSIIAQCNINYGALFANTISQIRKYIRKDTDENRDVLKRIFSGLGNSIEKQIEKITPVLESIKSSKEKLKVDADHFSDKNKNFKELEEIDEDNLKDAKASMQKLIKSMDTLNRDITKETIKAEENLSTSDVIIALGGLLGDETQALGLAIGLFFVVSAGITASQLSAEVEEEFRAAIRKARYQLEITELTEQILCLNNTSAALKKGIETLDDLLKTCENIIAEWNLVYDVMQSAQTALDDRSQDLNQIINEFNLGRASAEWEEVVSFAKKMEKIEVFHKNQKLVITA